LDEYWLARYLLSANSCVPLRASQGGCVLQTVDESSSDSDSDAADADEYETIYVECPAAITRQTFGHVVYDVSSSILPRAATSAESSSGRMTSSLGVNNLERDVKDRIITVWKSYDSEHLQPEPEVNQESDHVTESASLLLPCLEEVQSSVSVFYFFGWLAFLLNDVCSESIAHFRITPKKQRLAS